MLAKDDFKKAQIKQKNVRHNNLLSRRHFEAVPECCAQSLPVAASVTAALKIPAQFDKLLLSPSSRRQQGPSDGDVFWATATGLVEKAWN